MRVVFRADASLDIGTGHVMRCATLAQALAQAGHECSFISRDLPGNLIARTRALGFATHALPPPTTAPFHPDADGPPHAAWAGVPQAVDAAQSAAVLAAGCDWLVLDHYAFDARWTRAARPAGARVLVLDDLADRVHDCDLLLDQNLGHGSADYDSLVPLQSERLIGPAYALLRPQFAQARAGALAARKARGHALHHVMIFMGGADLPNATGQILQHLHGALTKDRHGIAQITVVMGPTAPAQRAVRAQAAAMPLPCTVLSDVPDMAGLMAQADLSIGAVGGAAWERCTLGLPTLAVVLAENQRGGAQALGALGAADVLGDINQPDLPARLIEALIRLGDPAALRAMSDSAAAITDGRGQSRVLAALTHPFVLRPARVDDAATIWHWRESLPQNALSGGANPPLAQHLTWFAAALGHPDRHMFTAEGETSFGHIRLDVLPDGLHAVVSIILAPDSRGKGFGLRLLNQLAPLARQQGLTALIAHVHPDNGASSALFAAAGYVQHGADGAFCVLRLAL